MRTLITLVLVAAIANVASAAITMQVVEVDNSSAPELADYVTQDIVVTTDTDWMGAQMIVTMDAPDQIYQHWLADTNPQAPDPSAPWPISEMPSLSCDSYVSNGVPGESVNFTGAVDLGGPVSAIFTEDELSIAWYTEATDDIGTLALAQVTLADTATGTWAFMASAGPTANPIKVEVNGPIVDGHMVPEPTTLLLLGLGGMAVIRRRSLLTK